MRLVVKDLEAAARAFPACPQVRIHGPASRRRMADKFTVRVREARAALAAKQYEQAISQLTAAIFLQPADPEGYTLRGDAMAELCDFHSAVVNYRKALQLTPERNYDGREKTARRLAALLDLRALSMLDEGSYESWRPVSRRFRCTARSRTRGSTSTRPRAPT